MNIMLKDTKYTRTVRALRNFVMTVLPLFFPCPDRMPERRRYPGTAFRKDDVTVRLNLSTRGVTAGEVRCWTFIPPIRPTGIKPAHCFPKPRTAQNSTYGFQQGAEPVCVQSPASFQFGQRGGEYQTKIRIPKGESEFYAFYAPNQTGKDLPYYTPGGILQNAVPWNFLGEGMEEVDREDIVEAAFPAIIREQDDGSLGIPVDNPYDGVTPSPSDEKIIDWTTTSSISWDDAPGISNRLHMGMLSGKLSTAVKHFRGAGAGYHNPAVP